LALIDAMVEQATQPTSEEVTAFAAIAPPELEPLPLRVTPPVVPDDPFGDATEEEWDFAALDRSIEAHLRTDVAETAAALGCGHLTFSRYRVVRVHDDAATFTKTLQVQTWRREMSESAGSGHARGHARKILNNQPSSSLGPTDGDLHLCGDWYHTPLRERDVVHVCSLAGRHRTDAAALPLVLDTRRDDDDLVLVVHPDMLLTPTTVAEAVTCSRRAVLKSLLGSTGLSCKWQKVVSNA